ncbi:hypothetical protein [Microbacterium sp. YY-01]|uniref:hypothetical protein n=1 Tax=Microbacterium sp. YY-01 TaxID=3421634 RepID=UPI003D17A14B
MSVTSPLTEIREKTVDLLTAARAQLDSATHHRLEQASRHDIKALQSADRSPSVTESLYIKATDGSHLGDVLRVVLAALAAGRNVDLSMGRPLSPGLHRSLERAGARVRVETVDRWTERIEHQAERVRIVGPVISRRSVARRVSERGLFAVVDITEVDYNGTREVDTLRVNRAHWLAA